MRKANIQNLTPFKPGQSGNLKGRPKKLPALDKLMADVIGDVDEDNSRAKKILEAIATKAEKGDTRAAEIILDRAFGKVKQSIQVEVDPIKTLKVERAGNQGQ